MFGLSIIPAFIAEIMRSIDQSTIHSDIYVVLRFLYCFFTTSWILSWISIMNIDVISIIFHTFDFWFKTWNLILWLITFFCIHIIKTDRYIADLMFSAIGLSMAAMAAFLLDAIPIAYKMKQFILICVTFCYILILIFSYFTYPEVLYNPFEKYNFKHTYTQISLKSTFMGSYCNIVLFIGKPLFTDIKDMLKPVVKRIKCKQDKNDSNTKKGSNNKNKTNNKNNNDTERLVCVYKRPKIKWDYKKSIASSGLQLNQTNILAKHVNDD